MSTALPARVVMFGAALALGACNCDDSVAPSPNQAPIIRIEEPTIPEGFDAVQVDEGVALRAVATVADNEDVESTLAVTWRATRTDVPGVELDLGVVQPDSTGWAETLLIGFDAGAWQVTAQVIDSDLASADAGFPLQVLDQNAPPEVAISQPVEGDVAVAGTPVTFSGSVYDDRGLVGISIEWFSSLDGVINTAPPSGTGLVTFSRSDLTTGHHTVTLRAVDEDGAAGSQQVTFDIVGDNSPPTTPVLQILPSNPITTDALDCLIYVGSSDPDGDLVTYEYRWFRDGQPTLEVDPQVGAEFTTHGEEWACEVTPTDGTLDGTPATATTTIVNSVPGISGAAITPDPGYEVSTLLCGGVGWSDLDGDPEGYQATWTVNGTPIAATTTTLTGADFSRGDQVQCEISPWDGLDVGAALPSNAVSILNSPPLAPTPQLTPIPVADILDAVDCSIAAPGFDADGDPLSIEVRWLRDGIWLPVWDGIWTIPTGTTVLGEEWTCQVLSFDGFDVSAYVGVSTTVMPQPGDFVITEFLADSVAVPDVAGEWVEVYNASDAAISLLDFELHDDGGDSWFIDEDLIVPPGARAVLARNADYLTNGGVVAAHEYSNFVLDDTTDQIVLTFLGLEVDRVDYDLTLYPIATSSRSLSFDPAQGLGDAVLNDDPYAWCSSSTPVAAPGSDFGTPGGPNDTCDCLFTDGDLDGWGSPLSCVIGDCNDADPSISPSAADVCENGIDENCDGADAICLCQDTDSDGDGYGDGVSCSPADCNDSNPFISPGGIEACNNVDENCDFIIDNGDPVVMCPATAQVDTTFCAVGGACSIASCQGGYFDVDGQYPDGCECMDEGGASACGAATDLGLFDPGNSLAVNGKLPTSGSTDWFRISFPANSGRPGSGTPTISLSGNPGPNYRFNVTFDCSGNAVYCGAENTNSWGLTTFEWNDTASTGYTSNGVGWPSTVYVQVYRINSGLTCEYYQLNVSR